jgi:hypothetical protein
MLGHVCLDLDQPKNDFQKKPATQFSLFLSLFLSRSFSISNEWNGPADKALQNNITNRTRLRFVSCNIPTLLLTQIVGCVCIYPDAFLHFYFQWFVAIANVSIRNMCWYDTCSACSRNHDIIIHHFDHTSHPLIMSIPFQHAKSTKFRGMWCFCVFFFWLCVCGTLWLQVIGYSPLQASQQGLFGHKSL